MKLRKQFLYGAFSLLMLGGCSSETLLPDGPSGPGQSAEDGEGVYMSVNIKMPTTGSTRSFTDDDNSSNDGFEVGQSFENSVNTVYIVLAKKSDNSFITWGEIPAKNIEMDNPVNPLLYKTTAKFSKSAINGYYKGLAESDTDRDINVFVFCNPTTGLRTLFEQYADPLTTDKTGWVNATGKLIVTDATTDYIWSENNFLMSNISIATRTFPASIEDWDEYTDENTPFNLSGVNGSINNLEDGRGPVQVERTAARFDFRDGSENYAGESNCYPVVYGITKDENDKEIQGDCYVSIKLNKMSLVNMNKEYYYLRHVTKTPDNQIDDPIVCGPELPWFSNATGATLATDGNYVLSPNATAMAGLISTNFDNYYNYPLFNNDGQIDNTIIEGWNTVLIDDVLKVNAEGYDKKDYKIWRYVTENSIPGITLQTNGQTTGIVFKGKMIGTAEALKSDDDNVRELANILNNTWTNPDGVSIPLTGDPNKDPILYKYTGAKNNSGGMYATWPNVEQAAKAAAIVPVWEESNDLDKYPEGGYWRLEINRSNSLFHAVFGDGTCGSYTFKDTAGKSHTVQDPNQNVDTSSPSYNWKEWEKAGKPSADDNKELNSKFKESMTSSGFTLYQTSTDGTSGAGEIGYYCYYYYWNRHNDNGKNGIMGPMEFCVVRNNVYKISVTKINSIGHPRITENDPNPPKPKTEDEIDDVYLTVKVEVLPWVVRVNDVEF